MVLVILDCNKSMQCTNAKQTIDKVPRRTIIAFRLKIQKLIQRAMVELVGLVAVDTWDCKLVRDTFVLEIWGCNCHFLNLCVVHSVFASTVSSLDLAQLICDSLCYRCFLCHFCPPSVSSPITSTCLFFGNRVMGKICMQKFYLYESCN